MEEGPHVRAKRKRGAPLKYGTDRENCRKETTRQRDATKVYLLSAHDEWRTAKQAYERKLRKPVTNREFALHLLAIHRKSKCSTCVAFDQSDDGGLPLDDTETQTICQCSCNCNTEALLEQDNMDNQMVIVATPEKTHQQGARRRKQSSPQGLHMDHPTESVAAIDSGEDNVGDVISDLAVDSKDTKSSTTQLLQRLHSQGEEDEVDAYTGEDGRDGDDDDESFPGDDDEDGFYSPDDDGEAEEMGTIPEPLTALRFKDDDEDEDWKSSEMSDDPEDVDYGTRKSTRVLRPTRKKVPPKVVKKVPPRMVRKAARKPATVKAARPRITLRLSTKGAPKKRKKMVEDAEDSTATQEGAMGAVEGVALETDKEPTKRGSRGRKKRTPSQEESTDGEPKPKPKPRGQSIFIRRVNWSELDKKYQCKICSFEHTAPLEACRHLLAAHPEMVGALREFLLTNTAERPDGEKSLYSIALEQPLPLLMSQHAENMQGEPHSLNNPADLPEKGLDPRIHHYTDMMMPGYMGTPPAPPHLAGMPSFQQSFNRPPLFDDSQNGVVPLHAHNLTNAAAALFGMGMALPDGSMIPSNHFVPSGNQEGVSTASLPSTPSTHSGMAGPSSTQQINHHLLPLMSHHSENRPECTRQTISQPQSPSQASPQVLPQLPRPSSHPPCLPTQIQPQSLQNDHHPSVLQPPTPPQNEPTIQGDQSAEAGELLQSLEECPNPPTNSSQPDPNDIQDNAVEGGTAQEDLKDFRAEMETEIKIEEEEEAEKPDNDDSVNSLFERDDLLTLMERWVKISLSCPHCNMKLPYMKRKDRHRCRRPSPHVLCDICGKSYPQTYFRFHYKRVHLPQDNVECPHCHKEFRPSSLSKHILERHKPFRPYKCGICGKEFNSKKHCDKHEAVHKTEKPHKCPTCNRGFTQRTNMKNHMRQHTGERPYHCHNCMKSFTHNVSLKNHLKRYHGIDLWQLGHTGGGRPKKE